MFTKTSVMNVKLIYFSIAHACLRRIFQYGHVYLHFKYNDFYICCMTLLLMGTVLDKLEQILAQKPQERP